MSGGRCFPAVTLPLGASPSLAGAPQAAREVIPGTAIDFTLK